MARAALIARMQQPQPSADDLGSQIVPDVEAQYPALTGSQLQVIDSRKKGMTDNRQLEYYPADEDWNPLKGRPTIEVFNPDIQGRGFTDAVAADMLHGLPQRDPTWQAYREQFASSLTPRQQAVDRRAYEEDRQAGEARSFPEWMKANRLDAYLRGYLFPDKTDAWRKGGAYTMEQGSLLERMRAYLKGQQ